MKTLRRAFDATIVMSLVMCLAHPLSTRAEWLVTPEEVLRFHDEVNEPLWLPKAAEGPIIELLRPKLVEGSINNPVAIELVFRVGLDASIDADSFRVYYGALKLDVTQRLMKNVKVQANGLNVDHVEIPAGSHRLVLQDLRFPPTHGNI
jgi:hypothetical protein